MEWSRGGAQGMPLGVDESDINSFLKLVKKFQDSILCLSNPKIKETSRASRHMWLCWVILYFNFTISL